MLPQYGTVCRGGVRNGTMLCSALSWLSVTSPTIHKQIGPFWCRFLGGCVCVHSSMLWISPTDSLVRHGSCCHNPHRFLHPEVFRLSFSALELWVVQSAWLASCSSLFSHKCETNWSTKCRLAHPGLPATTLPYVLSTHLPLPGSYQSG